MTYNFAAGKLDAAQYTPSTMTDPQAGQQAGKYDKQY